MKIEWNAIIQAIIASGVFSSVFSLLYKQYIEGEIKLLFDIKLKEYEAKLKLTTELGIVVGKDRIKEYKEVSSMVNSTRKRCQEIVNDVNIVEIDIKEFELEVRGLEKLVYDYSTTLRIDNIYEQIHSYKVQLMSVCKNLNNYKTLTINGYNERANGVKEVIIRDLSEIENDCMSISNNLKVLIEQSIKN